MKKFIFILLFTPLLLIGQDISPSFFYGEWEGTDQEELGQITLDEEGYATFIIGGQKMGGKEFLMNDKKGQMTYTLNLKSTPIEIDFTMVKFATGESKQMLGIINVLGENTIQLAVNFDNGRPTNFEKHDTVILTRK